MTGEHFVDYYKNILNELTEDDLQPTYVEWGEDMWTEFAVYCKGALEMHAGQGAAIEVKDKAAREAASARRERADDTSGDEGEDEDVEEEAAVEVEEEGEEEPSEKPAGNAKNPKSTKKSTKNTPQ